MEQDPRMGLVRVELNHMNDGTRRILNDTVGIIRDAMSFLIHAICDHIDDILHIGDSQERLTYVERLVHKTKDNPSPEYPLFDTVFYKLPSYIRRAAINAALGHITSHETRCDQYYEHRDFEISLGHHFTKMEPSFTYTPKAWPTVYKKESYKCNGSTIMLKVFIRNTWDWIEVSMPNRDHKCLQEAAANGKLKNPKLVFDFNKYYLEFPVQYECVPMPKDVPLEQQTVLSVDLGLNHGAVCSVVDHSGTVLAREFDPFGADTDRILHVINLIRKKASQSGKGQSLSSLYTKLNGLKDNFAKQLARWIVNLAVKYNVYGIVLENLSSIHGKGRGGLKARTHHWAVNKIRDLIRGMAFREGIRTFLINPKGTSMYAYDGSGKVVRDKDNYSLCTFTTGKRYNADLSASYNIAARYFLRAVSKSMPATAWSELKAKVPELSKRTTWTLNALRMVQAVLASAGVSSAA